MTHADITGARAEPVRCAVACGGGAVSGLEWRSAEASAPALHFAHANGLNAQACKSLLAPLAARFHVRASDARGHGFTTLPADPARHAGWRIHRDDLICVLEDFAARTGGPVLLAGHSMGGTASLLAAAARPDLVRGLALVEPVLFPPLMRLGMVMMGQLGVRFGGISLAARVARRRAVWPSREAIVESYRGRGIFRGWSEQALRDYVDGGVLDNPTDGSVRLACTPAWEAAGFRAQRHDAYGAMRRLICPLALMTAGIASTCQPSAARRLRRRDQRMAHVCVSDASHLLPMEDPARVRAFLLRFADRLDGAG